MGTLKQLRVAQLLDQPLASSKTRSSTQGVRSGVLLQLMTPERLNSQGIDGHAQPVLLPRAAVKRELQRLHCNAWWISRACLRATGDALPAELKEQILEEARRCCDLAQSCYYAFHVRCTAIGTARDCLSANWSESVAAQHGLQAQPVPLARCVAAMGGCYGGNRFDYEPPDLADGKAAIDEINRRLSGGIGPWAGGRFWHTCGALWCLRAPLFRIQSCDDTSEEFEAKSYRRLVLKKDGFEKWADELGGTPFDDWL